MLTYLYEAVITSGLWHSEPTQPVSITKLKQLIVEENKRYFLSILRNKYTVWAEYQVSEC